ncbi:MAG: RagB/SusD family nutrient uptake outer membrane protein, partial [Muribaculaceae bacterium]|nr:RagB/SusD family nutrient uptake outer membrane protein [Muribaculaceae bacterium]
MKKSIKYLSFALLLASAASFSSCNDFLEKQPSNELTKEKVLADWNLFEEFHLDTYNFLRHGAMRINNSWLDAATDLAETSFATGGTRTTFNIGNYYGSDGNSELYDTWESRYRGIRKCNMVLE